MAVGKPTSRRATQGGLQLDATMAHGLSSFVALRAPEKQHSATLWHPHADTP